MVLLFMAAESGKVSSIIELLGTEIDVNARDRHGRTPLECAMESCHVEAMPELVTEEPSSRRRSRRGRSKQFIMEAN